MNKMTLWRADRLQKQADWVRLEFARGFMAPTGRGSTLQWTIVGVVGIILGIYTIAVFALPPRWAPLFVLAVLCPFIMMIVGNVRRLLLAIIILDIPFQLDVNLGYHYDTATELNAIGGLSISVTTISLIILYALWLGELLGKMKRQSHSHVWTNTTLSLAAYLAFTILSVVVARDVMLAFYKIFMLVQTFLLYIYIVATVRTRQDVLFIVTMLLIGLFFESLIMIGLRFIGHSITIAGISARIDGGIRVGGTVGGPNGAASYLSLFLAPALAVFLTNLGQAYKWLAGLAFGLGVVALVFTLSRGGWIGFAVSLTILCLLAWRRGWLSLKGPLVIAFSVLLLSLSFQDVISARISGEDASSPEGRVIMMRFAWKIIQDHPLLGIGANNFALTIEQYTTPEFGGAWLHVVHNKYLLEWAEAGIGGLSAFLLFLGTTLHLGWQCWKLGDRLLSPLALGFIAAIVGQMVHMFLDIFHSRPQVQSLWLVASLITAMSHIGAMRANDPTDSW